MCQTFSLTLYHPCYINISMSVYMSYLLFDIYQCVEGVFILQYDISIQHLKCASTVYANNFYDTKVIFCIGNFSQVRVNLHRSWQTDQCNWHRLKQILQFLSWERNNKAACWWTTFCVVLANDIGSQLPFIGNTYGTYASSKNSSHVLRSVIT